MATRTDGVMVCAMSFSAAGEDGYPVTINEGTRLRSDNPIVQKFSGYFAPES